MRCGVERFGTVQLPTRDFALLLERMDGEGVGLARVANSLHACVISNMKRQRYRTPPLLLRTCNTIDTMRVCASIQCPFFRKSTMSVNICRTTIEFAPGLGLHFCTKW